MLERRCAEALCSECRWPRCSARPPGLRWASTTASVQGQTLQIKGDGAGDKVALHLAPDNPTPSR